MAGQVASPPTTQDDSDAEAASTQDPESVVSSQDEQDYADILRVMAGLSGDALNVPGSQTAGNAADGTSRTAASALAASPAIFSGPPHTQKGQPPEVTERLGNPAPVAIDIVLPVHNEEELLDSHVRILKDFLDAHAMERKGFTWNIVIADNASTDATWSIAKRLVDDYPDRMRALRISQKGRGRALKIAWGESLAQVVAYMDIDLSTDIKDAGFLVGSLLVGGADVAIGSRLLSESEVDRSLKREFISRTYNLMLRSYLGATFHDAQCGFKAMTAVAARILLPLIQDDGRFFDAELLLLAQNLGMLIYEIPVRWEEDKNSQLNIAATVQEDLEGMRRMKRTLSRWALADGRRLPGTPHPQLSGESGTAGAPVGADTLAESAGLESGDTVLELVLGGAGIGAAGAGAVRVNL